MLFYLCYVSLFLLAEDDGRSSLAFFQFTNGDASDAGDVAGGDIKPLSRGTRTCWEGIVDDMMRDID